MSGSALVTSHSSMAGTTSDRSIRLEALTDQLLSAYCREEMLLSCAADLVDAHARHVVPRCWNHVQRLLAEMFKELEVAANEDS